MKKKEKRLKVIMREERENTKSERKRFCNGVYLKFFSEKKLQLHFNFSVMILSPKRRRSWHNGYPSPNPGQGCLHFT